MNGYLEGRNGSDALARAVLACAFVVLVAGIVCGMFVPGLTYVASWAAVALLAYAWFRISSTNLAARKKESDAWSRFAGKVAGPLRHAHAGGRGSGAQDAPSGDAPGNEAADGAPKVQLVFHCPTCGQSLRVPKGNGVVKITCPRCHSIFRANS